MLYNERKLRLVIKNWMDYAAIDEKGHTVLDFTDSQGRNISTDEDDMFVDLNGFSYEDRNGELVVITRSWYEDETGNEVGTGQCNRRIFGYAARSFLFRETLWGRFDILMQDEKSCH